MENQSTYRIRTKLGESEPINIPVTLMQEYDSFEILSLNINTDDTYRSYTSTEGIVIGRVSTANNGLGIPNVRVSIFVPKGTYNQSDEEEVLYPFSAPTDMDGDRVRYNLLPSDSDVNCYQVIGTLPTKRKILDNETICEVFEKYYKYTTVTNEAGDFMLSNIPVGKQRIHIDADLSDIGPFLSQKPYNMIENLGFDKNRFESTRQFKTSTDLDSLAQVITQNKTVYVYPYWGDSTEKNTEMKITRTDLSLNYEFKTGAIFMGSVITDKQSNSIRQNCTATEYAGKMSEMITGPGRIEMIRKTVDNKSVEQFRIKGDMLINDNGVWCYMIPMNLDYVRTDEFGNIIPTDDPKKGVPTRARVRFRITLNDMESDNDAHKRCSYLVPNNPKIDDINFLKENNADYSFGSDTWDESFVDLFWNQVYTVKNYVPRIQKNTKPTNRKHTGIKMVNHFGDNNPFPYNGMTIKLTFLYRLICVIVHIFINLIYSLNVIISVIGMLPCKLFSVKIWKWRPFKFALGMIPPCIALSSEFCDDGINKNVTYPGCKDCVWDNRTKPKCEKEQLEISKKSGESAVCTNNHTELYNCVENQLAQQNEATSFNFSNDWINGCLYMPLWYRKIRPKKSFFFGLFKRKAKDQWCASENESDIRMASFCSHKNSGTVSSKNFSGNDIDYNITKYQDTCGEKCHERVNYVRLSNGVIVNRENILGQKVWYYKSVEVTTSLNNNSLANEYENFNKNPMVSKTLYATDIVLIGSMNDCDLNGIPKFFNYLNGSTYNMPTDILFTDTEIQYEYDEKGNLKEQTNHKISVSSGCDWGNNNEYGYDDGGLFYSIGCSTIKVDTESCINLRRICELGVGQDEMQYIENIDEKNVTGIGAVSINGETDELSYNELDYYLRPDGYISYDDIIDFNYRSMFATMNGNRLKTNINKKTGVREYDFRHLYIDNFDGSLAEIMKSKLSDRKKANYRFNYTLEQTNKDYLAFRMGDRPYYYDGKSLVQDSNNGGPKKFTLPKYQNSFYFYFGLKEGKTAIDLFNEQYNGSCITKTEEGESIPYEKSANGWCSVDSDYNNSFNHKTYDGYLKIDFGNISLPCTAILNSKNNSSVSYTIIDENGNTNINDEKVCFYGNKANKEDIDRNLKGCTRYYLRYENPSITVNNGKYENGVDTKELKPGTTLLTKTDELGPCVMLSNGEYNMSVVDGEGNQHSFLITLKGEYLQFDNTERNFGQSNNVLLKYYNKDPYIQYNQVAKSPVNNNKIEIELDEAGIPFVTRIDVAKNIKLNGTICLYNMLYGNSELDKFVIEVEPYDKEEVEGKIQYVDEDFYLNDEDKSKTWYKPIVFFDHSGKKECKESNISISNGREYVTPKSDSRYVYYKELSIEGKAKTKCYVIKCPKGDVNYRVRVTQLCQDEYGKYYKSQNYVERKIYVAQATPYKLFINDVDYDIIRNFKTGWKLKTNTSMQTEGDLSSDVSPFERVGDFNGIKGWLNISDINNNYAWGEDADKYGTENLRFDLCSDDDVKKYGDKCVGEYKIKMALEVKESFKPIEPQRYNYNEDSKYNEDCLKWAKELDVWENGYISTEGTRVKGYNDWTTISMEENLGGCCGYKYVEELSKILLNRLDFVDNMKSSFWIQSEGTDKTISYSVRTDDNPYDVWTIYNPEYVSPTDEDYNETKSNHGNESKRDSWICTGESTTSISDIKIPNITSFDSKDFGISEDSIRINNYKNTYDTGKTKCFAQDNAAINSKDSGSVSIKPPYLVACVNYEGVTKPDNLKKGDFYAQSTNENNYGLKPYKFGEIESNKRYVSDGTREFFQFYLIDKIFTSDVVCWAYMNNIPYYRPWHDYDEEANATTKLGYSIKTEGIVSGIIKNGITNSNGIVDDFDAKNIFDKDTRIRTFEGATEDDIPTKRCILFGENKSETKVFKNYRHIDRKYVPEDNQYRPVPNKEGELYFSDKDGNSDTTKTLYGSMKVNLKPTTLNDPSIKTVSFLGLIFSISTGENGDTSLTLKVSCSNSDTDKPITYYIFRASRNEEVGKGKAYTNKEVWYPLNAFGINTKEQRYAYFMECGGRMDKWDGSTELASQLFNKNTLEKDFRDKYDDNEQYIADNTVSSQVEWENEDGEVQYTNTTGYGNTGVFTNLHHSPYFVIAVTENNCRAISPVYDFSIVYYVAGLVDKDGEKILRTALVNVLDGSNLVYTKKPRNYYLTQYDFTINYTFANGSTLVTNDGVTYEKSTIDFVDKEEYDKGSVGASYYKNNGDGTFTIYTKTVGELNEGDVTSERPSGTKISAGKYSYKTSVVDGYDNEGNQVYEDYWVTVEFDEDGNMSELDRSEEDPGLTQIPTEGYVEIKTTDTETGESKVEYKQITYSSESEVIVDYDPSTPYFIRYNDKSLTDDEYNSLKTLLSSSSKNISSNVKYYVTDVTGLRHKCELYSIIKNPSDWKNKILKYPK